ncbi:hypothetical protein [Paraburkholderia acidipaludis]|uniref:hypothetical protein n=1 Tax=Paraburkholderia acidipaludis TaxID=660537 RepID=UPI000481225A|nr:hypothetical protein [Paraburkholderia acidipaludis]
MANNEPGPDLSSDDGNSDFHGQAAPESVGRAVADAYHTKLDLSLGRDDIAYVAGIFHFQKKSDDSYIDEAVLRAIYEPVNEMVNGDPDTIQQRCTNALSRLKSQSILIRADAGGVWEEGRYTLSTLGNAIGRYISDESSLTVQSLTILLSRIRAELADVIATARSANETTDWDATVVALLRYLVTDLLEALERRARGLDISNQQLRRQITSLFHQKWGDAADICKSMLNSVMSTLFELYSVLTEQVESLTRLLDDIAEFSDRDAAILPLVESLRTQLHRLHNWSMQRHTEWANYHGMVMTFIRTHVQMDPDNRMRGRIRDHIQRFPETPYYLVVLDPVPFLHMREVERPDKNHQVDVPAFAFANRKVADVGVPRESDIGQVIKRMLARLEQDGEIDLATSIVTDGAHLSDLDWYVLISRVTPLLLDRGIPPAALSARRWAALSARLETQSLKLRSRSMPADETQPNPEAQHPAEGENDV